MTNKEKDSVSKGFMQGWGFILLIAGGVIVLLTSVKMLME